jgi:hypothetical protein
MTMKNLVVTIATASLLLSTPAAARGHGGYGGDRHHRSSEHSERHHGGGRWVAPLIGGIVLGAIISSSRNTVDQDKEVRVYEAPPEYYRVQSERCVLEQRFDRYGSEYYVKRCYYQ